MKTKKFFLSATLALSFASSSYAVDLDSVIDDVLGGFVDKIFSELNNKTQGIAGVCFEPSISIDLQSADICSLASRIDSLASNVCSLIPTPPGFRAKAGGINLGLKNMCKSLQKDFSDIAMNEALSYVEFDTLDTTKKLPNGKTYNEYSKAWDVSSLMKDDAPTNLPRNYLFDNKQEELALLMDYGKSRNIGSKSPAQIKIEDIKAPASLEDYKNQINESVNTLQELSKQTSINQVSGGLKARIGNKENPVSDINEYINTMKPVFESGKKLETGYALKQRNTKYAVPTQEYVEMLRTDLQPKAVAQIRKQQIEEIQIINAISEKWDKKFLLAQLIADKELIMSQKFDEEKAREEIDKIAEGKGSNGSGGVVDKVIQGVM